MRDVEIVLSFAVLIVGFREVDQRWLADLVDPLDLENVDIGRQATSY